MLRVYYDDEIEKFDYTVFFQQLPIWRQEKVIQCKRIGGRNLCTASFLLLQKALEEEYGIGKNISFIYNETGKPSLVEKPDIYFNLSHCTKGVVCAISEFSVGVDIQDYVSYSKKLAQHIMTIQEIKDIEAANNCDRLFTQLWSMKEAYCKMTGTGITDGLKKIEIRKAEYPITVKHLKESVIAVCGIGNVIFKNSVVS